VGSAADAATAFANDDRAIGVGCVRQGLSATRKDADAGGCATANPLDRPGSNRLAALANDDVAVSANGSCEAKRSARKGPKVGDNSTDPLRGMRGI
jgi:hypothetical protein